jgi:hypothetical protein
VARLAAANASTNAWVEEVCILSGVVWLAPRTR